MIFDKNITLTFDADAIRCLVFVGVVLNQSPCVTCVCVFRSAKRLQS